MVRLSYDRFGSVGQAVVQWSSALVCEPKVPGSNPLYADHFSFFDITAEWPETTQIAAILSSERTNNVYICI